MTKAKRRLESRLRNYGINAGMAAQRENVSLLLGASAAAGLGAFICPPPAEAAVQYSGLKNILLGTNAPLGVQNIDIDNNGVNDFIFAFIGYDIKQTYPYFRSQVDVKGMQGAPVAGNSIIVEQSSFRGSPRPMAARLSDNYTVQNNLPTTGGRQWQAGAGFPFLAIKLQSTIRYYSSGGGTLFSYKSVSSVGKFIGKRGYLGLRFQISGQTHYGWIQFAADEDLKNGNILDWAYEDQPDTPIKAGDGRFKWDMFLPAIINSAKQK